MCRILVLSYAVRLLNDKQNVLKVMAISEALKDKQIMISLSVDMANCATPLQCMNTAAHALIRKRRHR